MPLLNFTMAVKGPEEQLRSTSILIQPSTPIAQAVRILLLMQPNTLIADSVRTYLMMKAASAQPT